MNLRRRPTVLLVVLLFLVIGAAFLTQLIPYRQIFESQAEVAAARAQLSSLQAENDLLGADVAALETPAEIERLAREKLGYARPGETAYVVLDPPTDGRTIDPVSSVVPEDPERTWVERLWDFVSGGDSGS